MNNRSSSQVKVQMHAVCAMNGVHIYL